MYRIDPQNGDIIIDGWEQGIADTPYGMEMQTQVGNIQQSGLSDMRNVNIISIPGEASVLNQTVQASQTPVSGIAYTVAAATDIFTYTGTTMKAGTAIVITVSTGTGGITSGNTYWVRDVSGNTFKVSATVNSVGTVSSAVNITSDGTGTFTTVNLGSLVQIIYALNPTFGALGIETSFIGIGRLYGVDTNGLAWTFISTTPNWVYLGNTGNFSTPPQSNAITYFNGYILLFLSGGSDKTINYLKDGNTSASWTYGWQPTNAVFSSRTFIDSDGILWFCSGSGIGQLEQLTTFDPTNGATYEFTNTALIFPPFEHANCIEQLGPNLLIGCTRNIMYSWDRNPLNAGVGSGGTPIEMPEAGITRIIAVNSNAYVFAGNRGRIYITNGANVSLYKKIPDHLSGTVEPYYQWGGAVYSRNQLYFSVSAFNPMTGVAIPNYGGIWAISTDTNAMRLTNIISYGTYAGFVSELAQLITTASNAGVSFSQVSLVVGWYDGISAYGSDYVPSSPTPYSNSQAYVDSDMIPIGTYLEPHTNANVEYKLAVPMVAGESVILQKRQNFAQAFTTIAGGIFTSSGTGSGLSGIVPVDFEKSQWIQLRVLLSSTATNPSYVRLRELRLR